MDHSPRFGFEWNGVFCERVCQKYISRRVCGQGQRLCGGRYGSGRQVAQVDTVGAYAERVSDSIGAHLGGGGVLSFIFHTVSIATNAEKEEL